MKRFSGFIDWILLFILGYLVLSCIACSPCNRLVDKCPDYVKVDSIVYLDSVVRFDTIISLEQDMYTFQALLDCDSNYNVVIRQLHEEKGKEKIKVRYILKDNTLTVNSYVDSIITLNSLVEYYKNQKLYIENPVDRELLQKNNRLNSKLLRKNIYIYILIGVSVILTVLSITVIRNIFRK